MMEVLKNIINFFTPKTVDEQMKNYIEKNGYPDEDVVFCDDWGRMSKIIGKNTFIRTNEIFKKHINKKIEK